MFLKSFLPLILLLFSTSVYSQNSEQFIGSSGGDYTNSQAQLSFTLGEVVVETISSSGNMLTQGFQQPNLILTTLIDNSDFEGLNVYPNPFEDILYIEQRVQNEIQISLIDIAGRVVQKYEVSKKKSLLDFSNTTSGQYFLIIKNKRKPQSSQSINLTKLK